MAGEEFYPSSIADHVEEIEQLKKLGFVTNPLNSQASSLSDIWTYVQSIESQRDTLPYWIDGVVIKIKDNELSSKLGLVGKTPRGWAAVKFPPDEITSKVTNLIWQVGRTGKLTPVIDMEPVELDGTTVKRATMHNCKEVVDVDLHIGDVIVVRKAGDIIPEVVKILENLRSKKAKKVGIPTHCPSCNFELVTSKTGVDLVCKNYNCKEQVVARLSYFTSRGIANIDGLSEKNIEKFVELYGISDVADLYDLPYDKIFELEGYGKKSVDNLQESVNNSRVIDDYKLLAGMGIEGVGLEVSKLIINKAYSKFV
jgi:DNA ligase (NAD+)